MHRLSLGTRPLLAACLLVAGMGLVLSRHDNTPQAGAARVAPLLLDDQRFGLNAILPDNTHSVPGISILPWATNAQPLGAKINRFSFDWQQAEPQADRFDFSMPEQYVSSDVAHGYSTIAVLEHTPYWATSVATTNTSAQVPIGLDLAWNDPDNTWGAFVAASAAHFRGRISDYEIWNEPDLLGGAGWAGSRAQFFQLIKVAYQAIKAMDPGARVITGGLNYNPTWLHDVLQADVADPGASANNYYFDAIGIHSYGRAIAPYTLGQTAHALLRQFGIPDKPVFATELGIPVDDDPPSSKAGIVGTTLEAQSYMVESFAAALAGGIDHMLWYRASDVGQPQYWGLFKYRGQVRATAATFHMIAQYFANVQSVSISIDDPITKIVLDEGQQHVTVIWNASHQTVTSKLYAQNAGGGTMVGLDGSAGSVTPGPDGYYQLTLAGATNNHGATSSDFIVGGVPQIIVETGPFLPTLTPTPTNSPIPTSTGTPVVSSPTATATETGTSTPTATNTSTPTATATPTFPAHSPHVYFAAGSSNPQYGEMLQMANPAATPARIHITFSGESGAITTTNVLAQPHALATFDVGALHLPPGPISADLYSDRRVAASRSLFFGVSATMGAGAGKAATDWYLPGIAGVTPISQVVTLSNPTADAAGVLVETVSQSGGGDQITTHVDPYSTRDLVIAVDGHDPQLATIVHADQPIVAEYTAYVTHPAGITGAPGISDLSRKWYAAEGYTASTSGDFIALYNPDQTTAARVQVQVFAQEPSVSGGRPVPIVTTLADFTPTPSLTASATTTPTPSATISPTGTSSPTVAVPITGTPVPSATDTSTLTSTSTATPSATVSSTMTSTPSATATLTGTAVPSATTSPIGSPIPYATAVIIVQPDSRATFNVGSIAPRGEFTVLMTSSVPIAANRILTFGPGKSRPTMVNMVEKTAGSWVFPGDTSAQEKLASKQVVRGLKEFITLLNPSSTQAAALTILTTDTSGVPLRQSDVVLPPCSRLTQDMLKLVGPGRHITYVTSANGVQVVAEQTFYFNGAWGGAAAAGSTLP